MANLIIKSYQHTDLSNIVNAWNESLPNDPITENRFLQEIVLDENFDSNLALVAENEDKEIVGFSLGIRRKVPYLTRGLEPDRGWISSFFITPNNRKKGFGKQLLMETEKRLIDAGTKEITLFAYSPNYFAPGADISYPGAVEFFDGEGYVRGEKAVSMQRELYTHTLSNETKEKINNFNKEGITFRMFQKDDTSELLSFVDREFDAGWVRNVLNALRNNNAEETILLALKDDKTVVGYCMRKIDGCDGRFGPIGVAENMRSKGLGGVLIELQMQEMRKRRIYSMYFLWTHGDAERFYEKHGLKPYRTFQLYKKAVA